MLPFWFVQERPVPRRDQALAYAAAELGCPTAMAAFEPGKLDELGLPMDRPVVCYGGIALGRALAELPAGHPWVAAHWCRFERFACRAWFAPWRPWLLSEHAEFVRLADMPARVDDLYSRLGVDGGVFLRPDGGDKDYDGGVVPRGHFKAWLAAAHRYEPPAETLVLAARPEKFVAEYRLFLVDGRVVTGSRYREGPCVSLRPGFPDAAARLAETAAAAWAPKPVFALDLAETPRGWRIVECNPFHCAGLYEADLPALVAAVSARAESAWAARFGEGVVS